MTTTDINEIGKQVAELLKEAKEKNESTLAKAKDVLAQRHTAIKPLLEQVWTALEAKQAVNGFKSKGAFAKSVGYTTRALQYIVYGRPEKKKKEEGDANTCSHGTLLKGGMLVQHERGGEVYRIEGEIRVRATKGDRLVFSFTAIEARRASKPAIAPNPPKVRKISAEATTLAIADAWGTILGTPKDENFKPEDLLTEFDTLCAQHPEWYPTRVASKRVAVQSHVRALNVQNQRLVAVQVQEVQSGSDNVKVKLTDAQAREVRAVGVPDTAVLRSKTLVFHGNYEEDAKVLVLKLEERIESLNKESAALIDANRDLYYESDMGASQAARDVKNEVKKLEGAITACNGAIRTVAFGSLDDEYNILEWQEAREQEREEKERATWEAESEKHAAEFDARREKAIVGWEQDSNSTWKNVDGRFIKKHRASFKIGAELDARYVVSDVEGVIGVVAVGDGAWDGLMKALETKREPMHPAAEALAAVVGSPDCPPETEEVV
jgi:hypothetical protein